MFSPRMLFSDPLAFVLGKDIPFKANPTSGLSWEFLVWLPMLLHWKLRCFLKGRKFARRFSRWNGPFLESEKTCYFLAVRIWEFLSPQLTFQKRYSGSGKMRKSFAQTFHCTTRNGTCFFEDVSKDPSTHRWNWGWFGRVEVMIPNMRSIFIF